MESVVRIASYIADRYLNEFGNRISEMKLHKLLYFTQRESLIQTGEPIFSEEFLAWRYGPVMVQIRSLYSLNRLNDLPDQSFIDAHKEIFDSVFSQYAIKDAWSLSRLSHGEVSWKNARKDLLPEQNGSVALSLEDIKKDAERIKLNRIIFDVVDTAN